MTHPGMLVVLTGPSAVGKGAICRSLLKRCHDVRFSVSVTTRPPRPSERDGVEYFFVTHEEFERRAAAGELLEWAEVYGQYYGTPLTYVKEVICGGEDVILDIDISGAKQVRERFPDGLFVFVIPPSIEELANRMKKRGTETEEGVRRRMGEVPEWLQHGLTYQYTIVNDQLSDAVEELQAIITAERCRVSRRGGVLIRALLEKGVLNESE